jgi:hypothetical protein
MNTASIKVGMRITTRLVRVKYFTNRNGLILSFASALICMKYDPCSFPHYTTFARTQPMASPDFHELL